MIPARARKPCRIGNSGTCAQRWLVEEGRPPTKGPASRYPARVERALDAETANLDDTTRLQVAKAYDTRLRPSRRSA